MTKSTKQNVTLPTSLSQTQNSAEVVLRIPISKMHTITKACRALRTPKCFKCLISKTA